MSHFATTSAGAFCRASRSSHTQSAFSLFQIQGTVETENASEWLLKIALFGLFIEK